MRRYGVAVGYDIGGRATVRLAVVWGACYVLSTQGLGVAFVVVGLLVCV